MPRFRITCRPWADNIEAKTYDVEELLEMFLPDGSTAHYWDFVETFYALEYAERYAEALVDCRRVMKEYD